MSRSTDIKGAVSVNDIAAAISQDLQAYTTEVEEKLVKSELSIAKSATNRLKQGGGYKERSGKYTKDWTFTRQRNGYVVHNRKNYQLTHLLEFGHATKNGGRTKAFPHIEPVEDWTKKAFEDEVKKELGN
ncbi:HK97 gp10 family phage protein [Oenococcus alcoholitolerans]|uniref:HK97 gp10 family phage protein n=1 Tax=Oenococcus alcoholitolerans TaxID=931074 RepID=UPI003F701AAB